MRQTLISAQKCFCAKPEIVFLSLENETVCKKCGTVFENDDILDGLSFSEIEQTVPLEMLCKTNLNLHQRKQVGGDPYDEQKVIALSSSAKFNTRRHNYHKDSNQNLLVFSDVCRKLSLNSTISEDCWSAFTHDKSNLTKAKKMCHAIFQTLQNKAIPYDEKSVQEIVCSSLGVKKASDQRGIIFKGDCVPAFESKETKRRFYLNLFVQQAQKDLEIEDVSLLRRNTQQYMQELLKVFPNTDCKTLAKKATEIAKLRCQTN